MEHSFAAQSESKPADTSRVFGLDLLRAIAILMIVYIHAMGTVISVIDKNIYLYPVTDSVSMFFVLSGYLIGRILIKTFMQQSYDHRSLLQFWIFRWFRTLPTYYLVLTILVIIFTLVGTALPPSVGLFYIFSQNIAWKHPSFFGEAWSLAVEEWFYLLMPLAMMVSLWRSPNEKTSRRRLLVLLAIVSLASIAARFPVGLSGRIVEYTDWDELMRKQVVMRFDALAIGVFGAYLSVYRRDLWTKHTRVLAVAGVILIFLDRHVFTNNIPYAIYASLTVLPLSTLLMMPYLSQLSCRRNVLTAAVEWISRRSYSMYLVNLALTYFILNLLSFSWAGNYELPAKYATYWIIVFVLSAVIHSLWEMPMMNLRERFRLAAPVHAYGARSVQETAERDTDSPLAAGTTRAG